jgi:hypothetical protein
VVDDQESCDGQQNQYDDHGDPPCGRVSFIESHPSIQQGSSQVRRNRVEKSKPIQVNELRGGG